MSVEPSGPGDDDDDGDSPSEALAEFSLTDGDNVEDCRKPGDAAEVAVAAAAAASWSPLTGASSSWSPLTRASSSSLLVTDASLARFLNGPWPSPSSCAPFSFSPRLRFDVRSLLQTGG